MPGPGGNFSIVVPFPPSQLKRKSQPGSDKIKVSSSLGCIFERFILTEHCSALPYDMATLVWDVEPGPTPPIFIFIYLFCKSQLLLISCI